MNMLSPADPQPFKLRIEDYALLEQSGAFALHHVELFEGVVVTVNAEHLPHTRLKNELMLRFSLAIRERQLPYEALVEASVALPPHNMPDVDIVVAARDARGSYLVAQDVAIVVEVAASSLRNDLTVKKRLYAQHALPEYWVIDLDARRVHQFSGPALGDYADARVVPLDGDLHCITLPGLVVNGAGIL